jgi:hypothetical protein
MNRALLAAIITTLVILANLVHLALADPKPLELLVRPQVGVEPQDLSIQLRVHPVESDRFLRVELDGPDFNRSSGWTLDGDTRVLYSFWWKSIPAGEYQIEAAIGSGSKTRAYTATHVVILSR